MNRTTAVVILVLGVILAVIGLLAIVLDFANPLAPGNAFLVWLSMGLGGGVLALVGLWLLSRSKKPSAATGPYPANVPQYRERAGSIFEVLYQPPVQGKGGRPSSLRVQVPAVTPTTLQFNKKSWFDRWSARVGISRETQIEDVDFDQAIYVRSPSLEYAEHYLADAQKRAAILALLSQGFQDVRLTGTDIEALWPGFDPAKNDHPERTELAADELFVLAAGLPADDEERQYEREYPGRAWHILLWIFAIGFAVLFACVFLYVPVREWDLAKPALDVFMIVYPIFVLCAGLLLKGTSTSHDRWKWLAGLGIVLVGLGSVGAVAGVNGWSDNAPGVERTAMVLSKRSHSGRTGRTYHVTVSAWDRPNESLEFTVSSAEFNQIAAGRSRLELTIGGGSLGIEWVRGKRVRP